jgi:hypothetical protein
MILMIILHEVVIIKNIVVILRNRVVKKIIIVNKADQADQADQAKMVNPANLANLVSTENVENGENAVKMGPPEWMDGMVNPAVTENMELMGILALLVLEDQEDVAGTMVVKEIQVQQDQLVL